MSCFLAPFLTEKDEADSVEGGIDPLGTEPLADALGIKLAPGVRERQQHPRFLTAIAVSLSLCEEFGEDAVARDGVTEPWLVFEWHVVHGLVLQRRGNPKDIRGLPGREKVSRAIDDGISLSAKRYLKTPSIFGFHGIYRLLAHTLGIERVDRLGERGYELLNIWAKEQRLDGFVGTKNGRGKNLCDQIRESLRDGLEKGAVARANGWAGWNFFSKHLAPYEIGRREARFLWESLLEDSEGFRREVLAFLVSDGGQRFWRKEIVAKSFSERRFHEALARRASADLRRLLRAIDVFERFARLAQDAFDDCLYAMTCKRGKVSLTEFGRLQSVKHASRQIPQLFSKVADGLEPFGQAFRFRRDFAALAEPASAGQWVEHLMEHHRKTQQQKPPAPKLPWVERNNDGSYLIRPLYRRDELANSGDRYVHSFRTNSLWSFASDLRRV